MKKKSLLSAMIVAMLFATVLTFGQTPQYRNLPIYRWLTGNSAPDNLDTNALDVSTITQDTTNIVWGGWDTASNASTYAQWWVKDYKGTYEMEATGYFASANQLTDKWFVSPYFSTKKFTDVNFSFSSECAKYVGPTMMAFVSTNYKGGMPSAATWDTLWSMNIPVPNSTSSSGWQPSGSANLDSYVGDSVCVAFHYTSTTGLAATYYLDSIQITGTPLGIHEISAAAAKISVFPNPVMSTVNFNSAALINKIEIYNMIGELVSANENVAGYRSIINIENLQSGIYIAKIQLKNGTVATQKLVKE